MKKLVALFLMLALLLRPSLLAWTTSSLMWMFPSTCTVC